MSNLKKLHFTTAINFCPFCGKKIKPPFNLKNEPHDSILGELFQLCNQQFREHVQSKLKVSK